ncbi:permease [Luteolibacter pohnpeiensis]|uniref:Permease n=1 Tax=Luteolibacter pohnpeiensis TaxID=454153 RepID=A0A934VVS5_9BACT|nr:permease [Luteolibacter pohnpeiensis]MBK1882515.1 permease [Luteolibacter pohnpeiensis]
MSPDSQQNFALAFLSILFEGAPFILLGTLISGVIDVYLPAGTMDRFLPKNRVLAILVSGLLGIVFPVCECAVVPVIRRLVKKGLPVSCGLTYMLAAPIVNPITALSTWKAFEGQNALLIVGSRLLIGYGVAVLIGLIISRFSMRSILRPGLVDQVEEDTCTEAACCDHDHEDSHACGCGSSCSDDHDHGDRSERRIVAAFRSAMKDFIDVAVYFTVGVTITALFNTGIAPGAEWLDRLANHQVGAPFALMVLAFVLSLCSTSDAFIAASLDKFTWGAKLAFLTFGPMMDVKLLFLYQTVLKRRTIVLLALGLLLIIGAICIGWQELVPHRFSSHAISTMK